MHGPRAVRRLQDLERETRRGYVRGRRGRAPAEVLAWNDAAWEVPWHNLVGEVGWKLSESGHAVDRWHVCYDSGWWIPAYEGHWRHVRHDVDAARVPAGWCVLVGRQVKVGRYYLEQLIDELDGSQSGSTATRKRLENPAALGEFLQLCHLRLLHERDVRQSQAGCANA